MATSLPETNINLVGKDDVTTLKTFCAGRAGVIDLWHTKCTRCPAALEKLNEEAGSHSEFLFIACALSQGAGNLDDVAELTNDWENLSHVFVQESDKDALKAYFGYTSVPYYVLFDKEGNVVKHGEPKSINILSTLKDLEKPAAVAAPAFTLDEDF